MVKPQIKCSRCNETFYNGLEYRIHFYKHLDEYETTDDKEQYLKINNKQ